MAERKPPADSIAANRRRDAEIRAAYSRGGITLAAIAKRYRITDARVWQIVRGYECPARLARRAAQPKGEDDA